MERLTPERIAELRLIAEAAAKGPWRVNKYGSIGAGELGITAAVDPTTTLALLDEIERLQHEVMHLRDFLAESEALASHLRQRYEALRSAVEGVVERIDAAEDGEHHSSLVDYSQYHAGREDAFERTGEWLREALADHGGDDADGCVDAEVSDDAVAR